MMNNYSPCPNCGETDLWRPPGQSILRCAECGWSSDKVSGETVALAYVVTGVAERIVKLEAELAALKRELLGD